MVVGAQWSLSLVVSVGIIAEIFLIGSLMEFRMTLSRATSISLALMLSVLLLPAHADSRINILNAEDLVPLDGGQWVLASSMRGGLQTQGGIYAIDTRSGEKKLIYPLTARVKKSAMAICPGPVKDAVFAPHGITVHKENDGTHRLYVVNHGDRESVEIFDIESGDTPALRWVGCIPAPQGASGNAVAVADDGTLFMTNMGAPIDGSPAISPMGGDVISWTAANGWQTVPNSAIVAPNGLLVSGDGQQIYVASWPQSELFKLMRSTNETKRDVIKLSLLPDNLRWNRNGNIVATGHRTTAAAVVECFIANARCEKSIPSAVEEIDAHSFTTRCNRAVDASMATVAVDVGAEVWIGSARGETILRVPRTALACTTAN